MEMSIHANNIHELHPEYHLKQFTSIMRFPLSCLLTAAIAVPTFGFAPHNQLHYAPPSRLHPLQLAAISLPSNLPNPFKKLPWNVQKEKERQTRRFQQERAQLHRQLGIVEDASYEDIVAATDRLIAANANDLKRKVQIEIAKDRILQLRLNERMAGLASVDSDARAQSTFETEGCVLSCCPVIVLVVEPANYLCCNRMKEEELPLRQLILHTFYSGDEDRLL
jgi:hypothetical protein